MAKPAAPRASSSKPTAAGRSSPSTAAGRSSTRKKASSASASVVNDASLVNSAPLAPKPGVLASEPSHEQIAARAYGLWLSRGAHDGDAFGDWVRAEHELRTQN